jgi:hypothetical protein
MCPLRIFAEVLGVVVMLIRVLENCSPAMKLHSVGEIVNQLSVPFSKAVNREPLGVLYSNNNPRWYRPRRK